MSGRKRTRGHEDGGPARPRKKPRREEDVQVEENEGTTTTTAPRVMDPILVPLRQTYEDAVTFSHGAVQRPAFLQATLAHQPRPHTLLPPPEQQTTATLAPTSARPMLQFLADFDAWHTLPAAKALQMTYAPSRFALAAQMMVDGRSTQAPPEVAQAIETIVGDEDPEIVAMGALENLAELVLKPPRFLAPSENRSGGGTVRPIRIIDLDYGQIAPMRREPIPWPEEGLLSATVDPTTLKTNERQRLAYEHERQVLFVAFMAEDPLPHPELPFGLAPAAYPMYQSIVDKYGAMLANRQEFMKNTDLMPKPTVVIVTMDYLQECRERPDPEWQEFECSNQNQCRVRLFAIEVEHRPEWAYIAKKFQSPEERREWRQRRRDGVPLWEEKPGPCADCLIFAYTVLIMIYCVHKRRPLHAINCFQVVPGVGGYARSACIGEEMDGYPTGISGFVPMYSNERRQFRDDGKGRMVLQEVNVDFHMSLSQSDAFLGVRKAAPLAGSDGRSHHALPGDFLAQDPVAEAIFPSEGRWRQFLRAIPRGVLAERAIVLGGRDGEQGRAPVLWLRRFISTLGGTKKLIRNIPPPILETLRTTVLKTLDVAARLQYLAQATFTTFERSVAHFRRHPDWFEPLIALAFDRQAAANVGPWAVERLFDVTAPGFEAHFAQYYDRDSIWAVACMRVAVCRLFSHLVRPWDPGSETTTGSDFKRFAQYFIDTHLLFLGCRPDRTLLGAVYPVPNGVLCAEEMPDMTGVFFATNPFLDSAAKKIPSSLLCVLLHIWLKVLNYVCQRREFESILCEAIRTFEAIKKLIASILAMVLLGNCRGARHPPEPLVARLRILKTFHSNMSTEDLCAFIEARPLTVMRLLRMYYFDMAERSGFMEEVRSWSHHWQRFKALSQQTVGELRRFVTYHILKSGSGIPWDEYERVVGETSVGEVLRWHDREKDHNIKMHKGTEVDIMLKKMTSVEKVDPAVLAECYDWIKSEGRFEAVNLIAWKSAMALHWQPDAVDMSVRPVLCVGELKLCGFDEESMTVLRRWLHGHWDYKTSDNSFAKIAAAMLQQHPHSFLLLKVFLRLIEFYRDDVGLHLPITAGQNALRARRQNLAIEPWASTPPDLRFSYCCEGCMTWANTVIRPSRQLLGMTPRTTKTRKRKKQKVYPLAPTPIGLADGSAVSMAKTYYNPLDTCTYCRRVDFGAATATTAADGDDDTDVMRDLARINRRIAAVEEKEDEIESPDDDDDDDDDDEDDEESEEEEEIIAPEEDEKTEKCIARPLFTAMTCNVPLMAVNLMAYYKILKKKTYGVCHYCSNDCEMLGVNGTSRGLSCGRHALRDEYEKSHRLWNHIIRPEMELPKRRYGQCMFCNDSSVEAFDVHDMDYRMMVTSVCKRHLTVLRPHIPVNAGCAPMPVRIDFFLKIVGKVM